MRQPNQIFIFNDHELDLIKQTFADNETLLYTVRKVLLQFPLTDVEKGLLKMSITPAVHAVLKKRILPEISDDFPLGQLPSILTTLTEQLKVKTVEEMSPLMEAKVLEMAYLEQQFEVLKDIDADMPQTLKLKDFGTLSGVATTDYIHLQAYLFLLGYIDPMLGFIKAIAGEKKETVEQAKARMSKNSNQ